MNFAKDHIPEEHDSKKRKADTNGDLPKSKKKATAKTNKNTGDVTLGEREENAMQALFEYVEEKGGSREAVKNFRCRVTRKPSDGRYDTNYYNEQGRRFRSMVEVGRFLKLVVENTRSAAGMKRASMNKRKATTREVDAEKRKLRKELEKLQKQHTKATKTLDDFLTDEKESRYPIEDLLLQEEEEESTSKPAKIFPTKCAAARIPDIDSFPGLPQHCMPDVLVAWDFLCTFTRAISVNPISLDDFVQCLTYKAPDKLTDSDALNAPPVYLGEAHLGLMKLVLTDRSSDDWWWSILETDQTENAVADLGEAVGKEESNLPLIKVDFAALLCDNEDPLLTNTWLQNLEAVHNLKASDDAAMRTAVKNAMAMTSNKWVLAYLRKALKLGKTSGTTFMKRATVWLVDRVRDARPDLNSRVGKETVFKQRAKIVEEVSQQMEKLSAAALKVTDDDLVSDVEDSDDESDDSDDEEDKQSNKESTAPPILSDPGDRPASYIPTKPLPTLVDLLLPPGKPVPPTDLINPPSWPYMAGAAACRIIHRYRRLRNEVDDSLRQFKELPRLTVKERREREAIASNRVFSEFAMVDGETYPSEHAVAHLCKGGNYLDLSPLERLCILRILIDAAYDTGRLYEVIDSNHKQRTNAIKALDTEQRKAKKEARERAAADEAAARQDLAMEARRNFIEEKRDEIRKANEAQQELTNEEIDSLTEEDILEDEDIKADYDALPKPESYKKAEVLARVAKIQEAAAFDTELLTVLSLEDLLEREKAVLAEMEEELRELGGEDALLDPTLDTSIARTIEKLRRELGKIQTNAETLPVQREAAIDTLKEAIAEGTIKSLRGAIRIAKTAKLLGPDLDTNGVWALDIVRDAHMELENAKQLKRVSDAQKDLISKRNKCFIRTDPLGSDRFRNRFWHFENSDQCHVWAEVNYVLKESNSDLSNEFGYLELVSDISKVSVASPDIETDFEPKDDSAIDRYRSFSRREYHQSGLTSCLAKRYWGCHLKESSVRPLMKGLDSRGTREARLKKNLKETLEEKATTNESGVKTSPEDEETNKTGDEVEEEEAEAEASKFDTTGDEKAFEDAKRAAQNLNSDVIQREMVEFLTTGIGQNVRIRIVVEASKENEIARYEVASVAGWKLRRDTVSYEPDGGELEPQTRVVETPIWRAVSQQGNETWLSGSGLIESICRFTKWKNKDATYFESDAVFLAYRNALGRHCGKAADAPYVMTPIRFAQYMVRREAELYQRLKQLVFDNTWGGKNSSRNAWVTSMRDFAFDFETARDGLLSMEAAFFELTGGFPEANSNGDTERSGRELLDDPVTREDIELESIEKTVNGLWNSPASRAIFLEIVKSK